jgi:hypothetical protein
MDGVGRCEIYQPMKLNLNQILLILALIWLVTYSERFLNEYHVSNVNERYEAKKVLHEQTINTFTNEIFKDSIIISNSSSQFRDSLRAKYNPR